MKNKIKKSKRSNLKYNKNKIGGVKLGQGSYGCVVTPPAKCIRNPYLRKNNYIIDDLYVSKIIDTKYSEVSFSELNIHAGFQVYDGFSIHGNVKSLQ